MRSPRADFPIIPGGVFRSGYKRKLLRKKTFLVHSYLLLLKNLFQK
jgi:hypothetical protein